MRKDECAERFLVDGDFHMHSMDFTLVEILQSIAGLGFLSEELEKLM